MNIDNNCIVSIRYTLSNDKGEQLDQSPADEPLVYLHGSAGVLPALESALEGMGEGEDFNVMIAPADGFGEHLPSLIRTVPRSAIPDDMEIEVGSPLMIQSDQGDQAVTVTAIDDTVVTIDANHPLAGMTLCFEGKVEAVRLASDVEVQHWPNPPPAND